MQGRRRLIVEAVGDMRVGPDAVVLDVAAGDGGMSSLVAGITGGRLVTHDLDPGECGAARDAGLAPVRGDVRRLPFADAVADITIVFEIVEHFTAADAGALVAELARVTKPGGALLLSTPNRYSLESWKGMARYIWNGTVWNARDDTHVTIFSRRSLHAALRPHFDVERTYGYFLLPEIKGRASPLTHRVTSNPVLSAFCHKLFVVARKAP